MFRKVHRLTLLSESHYAALAGRTARPGSPSESCTGDPEGDTGSPVLGGREDASRYLETTRPLRRPVESLITLWPRSRSVAARYGRSARSRVRLCSGR
jgi:hypothetical protein